nr:multiple organellar RNA editing factor 7, mitochondrial [Ipomoea batatas]
MLRKIIFGRQSFYRQYFQHPSTLISSLNISKCLFSGDSSSLNLPPTELSGSTPVDSLVNGCDYNHWLVVMDPPDGYPLRDQIVHRYIQTLALAVGSEEEAKRSIYSVSTKYYYAFSCKIPEKLTHSIKALPGVRWVLPDSYLPPGEDGYGGEPFVYGEVVPYDEKYHHNWSTGFDRSWPSAARRLSSLVNALPLIFRPPILACRLLGTVGRGYIDKLVVQQDDCQPPFPHLSSPSFLTLLDGFEVFLLDVAGLASLALLFRLGFAGSGAGGDMGMLRPYVAGAEHAVGDGACVSLPVKFGIQGDMETYYQYSSSSRDTEEWQ